MARKRVYGLTGTGRVRHIRCRLPSRRLSSYALCYEGPLWGPRTPAERAYPVCKNCERHDGS